MMPIRRMNVKNFRGMHEQEIDFQGKRLNAIIGQNSAMKTTLLGMIATPFSIRKTAMKDERTIDGEQFQTLITDKFRFSDTFDIPGSHRFDIEVNQNIYSEKNFEVVSISRTNPGGRKTLRFWSAKGRSADDSFVQCPVLFLSLKRLIPIPELSNVSIDEIELESDELELYKKWHSMVLINLDDINTLDIIKASAKNTMAPNTDYYDSQSVSAGQDNLGKIILAILSMKRLKDKYPEDYKGGIICIDEIESTFYPASQMKLLELLKEVSEDYSIQFFFTTHSMTIINKMFDPKLLLVSSMTYTKKIGRDVKVIMNPSIDEIRGDLYLRSNVINSVEHNVHVYCEDDVALEFLKCILGRNYYGKGLKFQGKDCNLGYPNYQFLLNHNVAEFLWSIIVLDGDVRGKKEYRTLKKYKNVVFLPTDKYPEQLVYDCLCKLDENDEFWDNSLGGYTKQQCFRDYRTSGLNEKDIKKWYDDQGGAFGTGHKKMIKRSLKDNQSEIETFLNDFAKAYEYISKHVL